MDCSGCVKWQAYWCVSSGLHGIVHYGGEYQGELGSSACEYLHLGY